MNSRRYISNITPKEGLKNFYEIHIVWNKDKRGNHYCITLCETFYFNDNEIQFESDARIKKVTRILNISKKRLMQEIKTKLTKC